MKNYYLVYIIFLISIYPLYGQEYSTKYIIHKADSILHKVVGDSVYRYFTYDTNSYYEYKNDSGKTSWKTLNEFSETQGNFVNVEVRFNFIYPPIKEIRGLSTVKLDKDLIFQDSIYLNFIPDFIKENRKCDFISSKRAVEIAKEFITKKGKNNIDVILNYDKHTHRYIYFVEKTFEKSLENTDDESRDIEYVTVDAVSGKVLEHQFGQYFKRIK